MNRDSVQTLLDHAENALWNIQLDWYQLSKKGYIRLLKRNNVFENKFDGRTCFILGNGPSLKLETRLGELTSYSVFTVNQMYRSDIFELVKPDFHVMVDPLFFELDPNKSSDRDTLDRIKGALTHTNINFLFPIDAYNYIIKNFGNRRNVFYIKNRFRMCQNYGSGFDMTKYLPATHNVVQSAIYCAIYMGFKRIVLLGCDMTGLLDSYVRRSPENDQEKFSHVYEYTNEEKARMHEVHIKNDNELMLSGFTAMFHDFKLIYRICQEKGIDIVNTSQITALDCLPFANLNDVLDQLEERDGSH